MSGVIKPGLIVESPSLNHECIAIPFPRRVSEPRWLRIDWQGPAIGVDLAKMVEFLVQNQSHFRGLHKLKGSTVKHRIRDTVGKAALRWPARSETRGPLLEKFRGSGTHRDFGAFGQEILQTAGQSRRVGFWLIGSGFALPDAR